MTAEELLDRLTAEGVLFTGADEHAAISSGVLQPLLSVGVVEHPPCRGGKWRYRLATTPRIQLLV